MKHKNKNKNIQLEQEEKPGFKKMRTPPRNLWDNFKCSNIGVPEGEVGEQEIENLFEKIMKENSPNLAKEIGMQVQEAQGVPNKLDPKEPHQDTS